MSDLRYLVTFFALFWVGVLSAQENISKLPAPSLIEQPDNDVDLLITNNKMRAETGSKSKYSLASALNYAAGSLNAPFSDSRPNLSGATGTTDYSALGGAVSLKYLRSMHSSWFGGVGLRWLTPFAGSSTPQGYNGTKFDVDNPYLTYQYLYRWFTVQSALTLNETFFTNTNLVRDGYVTSWNVAQNNIYELGNSGFSFVWNVYANASKFNKDTPEAKQGQSDYGFGIAPALEYRLTQNLILRTDNNMLSYQHVRDNGGAYTFQKQHWAQTLDLGWSVTRDIFIYPGFQWLPEDPRIDRTVTWLNANLNVF